MTLPFVVWASSTVATVEDTEPPRHVIVRSMGRAGGGCSRLTASTTRLNVSQVSTSRRRTPGRMMCVSEKCTNVRLSVMEIFAMAKPD
jgi:hypothetical protein